MKKLKTWDIFALGFMTFALFLGAGNITQWAYALPKELTGTAS